MLNKILSISSQMGVTMIEYPLITALAMLNKIVSIKSQKGVTMIEYALIAALVAVAAIAAVTLVGTNLQVIFTKVSSNLK